MPVGARCTAFVVALLLTSGCHEELGIGEPAGERIEVTSFSLEGVKSVDESRLRDVLETEATPWLPWSEKKFFDRDAFERDLKRIEAYYEDQGYPQAEIVSSDIDLGAEGETVRLNVVVNEGEPLRVAAVELEGFAVGSGEIRNRIRARLFVKLKQRFGPEAVREAIVEYRLTDWWRLQTSVAEGDAASRNLLQRVERGGIDMLFWFSY